MAPVNPTTTASSLLDELAELARDDRNDLAVRLLQINALHDAGEITDEDFARRRAGIYAR